MSSSAYASHRVGLAMAVCLAASLSSRALAEGPPDVDAALRGLALTGVAMVVLMIGLVVAASLVLRVRVRVVDGALRACVAPLSLAPRIVRAEDIARAHPGHVYRFRALAFHTGGGTCRTCDGDWVYGVPMMLGLFPLASRWRPQGLLVETKAGARLFFAVQEWEALGAELAGLGVAIVPAEATPLAPRAGSQPHRRVLRLWAMPFATALVGAVACVVGTAPSRAWRAEQARRYEGVWREIALVAPNGDAVPLSEIWGRKDVRAGPAFLTARQSELSISRGVAEYTPPFTSEAAAPYAYVPTDVRNVLPLRYRWRVARNGDLVTRNPLAWFGARFGLSARLSADGRQLVVTHGTSGGLPLRSVFERAVAAGWRQYPPQVGPGQR